MWEKVEHREHLLFQNEEHHDLSLKLGDCFRSNQKIRLITPAKEIPRRHCFLTSTPRTLSKYIVLSTKQFISDHSWRVFLLHYNNTQYSHRTSVCKRKLWIHNWSWPQAFPTIEMENVLGIQTQNPHAWYFPPSSSTMESQKMIAFTKTRRVWGNSWAIIKPFISGGPRSHPTPSWSNPIWKHVPWSAFHESIAQSANLCQFLLYSAERFPLLSLGSTRLLWFFNWRKVEMHHRSSLTLSQPNTSESGALTSAIRKLTGQPRFKADLWTLTLTWNPVCQLLLKTRKRKTERGYKVTNSVT